MRWELEHHLVHMASSSACVWDYARYIKVCDVWKGSLYLLALPIALDVVGLDIHHETTLQIRHWYTVQPMFRSSLPGSPRTPGYPAAVFNFPRTHYSKTSVRSMLAKLAHMLLSFVLVKTDLQCWSEVNSFVVESLAEVKQYNSVQLSSWAVSVTEWLVFCIPRDFGHEGCHWAPLVHVPRMLHMPDLWCHTQVFDCLQKHTSCCFVVNIIFKWMAGFHKDCAIRHEMLHRSSLCVGQLAY